jgi:hypothetical protein
MNISLQDLNIVVDTLLGSASIADGGTLFKYSQEAREGLAKKLLEEMSHTNLHIIVDE